MDRGANSDLFFLPDEKFDFDVSLSPASSTGDDFEDEVFVGPVGHRERCVSAGVASRRLDDRPVKSSWSPLSGEQLEAICEEAQKVAEQLQSSEHAQSENTDPNRGAAQKDEFVRDAEAKLSMLCRPVSTVLSPIKRQTFCVHDSPLKQLPPAIQNRILKACSPKTSAGTNNKQSLRPVGRAQPTQRAQPMATRSVASPTAGARTQAKAPQRGRTGSGVAVVLPSRPVAPTAPRPDARSRADKARLQPPSRLSTSWRRSPNSSRNGSCEDLLSDSASVASDVSDSSMNSSCLGKRALAPPTKAVHSGVKPPSDGSRLRNTSSSSSSVSSFNSSTSLSPANKVKLNSSLNSSHVPKPSRNPGRRSVVVQPQPDRPFPPAAGRRSLSAQTRKPSNPTPLRRPESTTSAQTPGRRGSGRTGPVAAVTRLQSGPTSKPKAPALVLPTPNGPVQGSPSKILKPKRLLSMKSVDCLHQKPALLALTPSGGGGSSLQLKPHRPSALPTPVRSRISRLPQATPTRSPVRPVDVPPTHDRAPASLTPTESPECAEVPLIQPFNLEEEEPAQPPPTIAEPDRSEGSAAPDTLCPGQSQTRKEAAESELKAEAVSKEVLLLDLPAPVLRPQEKLLIDLRHTPDLIRNRTGPSASELIDLSSPLIKWSPVDKEKNDAPLINLSF
ncbi:G2 and S phase-expressed protein 1 [Eucyclogobius newberryi]|uniref:G2 and S phase-expressed protein 1 n=1 Tax=Eucyclogobius newberryi TaxID=166745 RepID=UPI003B5A8C50